MAELYTFYKIVSKDGKYIYVGSTKDFNNRMRNHKSNCKNENSKCHDIKVYEAIRNNGGWRKFNIEKIEEKLCEDKKNAYIRENELMKELKSNLNERPAYSTSEEKQEQKKQQQKRYYIKHNEKINDYKNTKNICKCGGAYTTSHKSQHSKTKKHKQFENQTINNITNNYNITNLTINN